ncbi:Alpha helical Porin B [Corynebacterium atrinae]|uniref:hypothetical protein n=1 Tax=Corynebacterium atrinae TaxID=1336740 RepID=UPI0025B4C7AA|nr:hypothetical protein [Corynebacterium atrinae]WJY62908.1 Alpha helical Porin B [Corynebacterium atrinae]
MNISARKTLATIAASSIALVGLAPAASAFSLGDILTGTGQAVNALSCKDLDNVLNAAKLKDSNTTRNGLVKNISGLTKEAAGNNIMLALLGGNTASKVADRALECKLVKEDPKEIIPGSSQVNDIVAQLSS